MGLRSQKGWERNEVIAREGADGVGAATAAVPESEKESEAERGMASGDAAGGRDTGNADCPFDGFLDEDGISNGAVGTAANDHDGAAWEDGAGAGVRSCVWAGAVASVARGPGDGACGAGVVEEEVYRDKRDQGRQQVSESTGQLVSGFADVPCEMGIGAASS